MISRAHMRRQLRANGGITNLRQGYGLGDFVRKLIPNELADIASKTAPFVAPFNPLAAGIMRGVGRYDKRGNLKDALKQGVLTYAGGKGARYLGGVDKTLMPGQGSRGFDFTMDKFKEGPLGRFVPEARQISEADKIEKTARDADSIKNTPDFVKEITEATIGKVPLLDKLPPMVQQKLLVGTIASGAEALYNYFADTIEPEEGESPTKYMARRDAAVRKQMRTYMDSYYTPLVNPQYAAMSSEEKDAFIEKISPDTTVNMNQGGRVGLRFGGDPLPEDPTEPINPFRPKPIGPVLPNKRMASDAQNDAMLERLYEKFLEMGLDPEDAAKAARREMERMQVAQGGRIGYDDGTMNPALLKRMMELLMQGMSPDRIKEEAEKQLRQAPYIRERMGIPGLPVIKEAAQGGRIGYAGGGAFLNFIKNMTMNKKSPLQFGKDYLKNVKEKTLRANETGKFMDLPLAEVGIPAASGALVNNQIRKKLKAMNEDQKEENLKMFISQLENDEFYDKYPDLKDKMISDYTESLFGEKKADGGRIGYAIGSPEKQLEAGAPPIMYSGNMDPNEQAGLPSIPGPMQMAEDGPEFDMRENGGFQPLGRQEGKDDVPAILAKNEFVMTADAVRAAGGGSIEKGAQKMYDTMKQLESRVV